MTSNKPLTYAICRGFEIIGETTKNAPDEIRIKYSISRMEKMAGIRDKIIHDYFGIDYAIIWKTIETKIPV